MAAEKMVVELRCGDGKEIDLDEATAQMSGYVRKRLVYARKLHKWEKVRIKLGENKGLCRMPSDLAEKVFDYCRRHAHAQPNEEEDLKAFDARFVDLDYPELCRLIKAAIEFEVECLLEKATLAYDMTGKNLDSYWSDVLAPSF